MIRVLPRLRSTVVLFLGCLGDRDEPMVVWVNWKRGLFKRDGAKVAHYMIYIKEDDMIPDCKSFLPVYHLAFQ